LTAERLRERGAALGACEALGGRTGRLVWLDAAVRGARFTDWPGRPPGPEPRTAGAAERAERGERA
jgi:hypothetical protein